MRACTNLSTCRKVVIHCQWDFGLFTTDNAVRQGEVDEEGLKCAQFSSLSQTQTLLPRQTNSPRHPCGDGIGDIQT